MIAVVSEWTARAAVGVACIVLLAGPAAAAGTASPGSPSEQFPPFDELVPNVEFWTDVFAVYSSSQAVYHDMYDLGLVYRVVDFSDIVDGRLSAAAKDRAIRARLGAEKTRIAAMLKSVAAGSLKNDEEKRIAALLTERSGGVKSGLRLAGQFRYQRGLADRLCGALGRKASYAPEASKLLARHGVPVDLLALPLVESSYTIAARSYAGAVGIWQFTWGTGRRFMHIDHTYDDRRDPMRSTEAAARYLRENYDRLGSWPLAITAYNHGAGGVAYAVRKLGTEDLGNIVTNYRSRRFGFASRNFYSEFLAARDVAARVEEFCPGLQVPEWKVKTVELDHYVALSELASCAGVDEARLVELNPALSHEVIRGRAWVPSGYKLNLPADKATAFGTSYAALAASSLHSEQQYYLSSHRVGRGQTLSQLARSYRTTVRELQRINNIVNPRSLRYGQLLKIPVAGSRSASPRSAGSAAIASSSSAASSGQTRHLVRRGETLDRLARRYGTTVGYLQYLNGIRDPRSLKYGTWIQIRRGGSSATASAASMVHQVRRGQTLSQIARIYGTSVPALQRRNSISDPRKLRQGQALQIP
ncbi:MAG: LysM peptidoglycan-binding domain-containing protein [Deltaproteobacteria bacterium]|nr:LysM peptidoglycan-binding domain-containing protein [Deltaproteobacteria bacterium]